MDTDNTVIKLHGHVLLFCLGETLCGLLRQIMIKIFTQEETLCHCFLPSLSLTLPSEVNQGAG